jgi:copper chaperone NosL
VRLARIAAALAAVSIAAGCGAGAPVPAALDTRNDACAFCRMPVSDPRLAAQLASPGEDARFFDDVGCLRSYLAAARSLPARTAVWVADHETGRWVPAADAVYERCPGVETPMGSHLIAHAAGSAPAKRGAGCEAVPASAILGTAAAGGTR